MMRSVLSAAVVAAVVAAVACGTDPNGGTCNPACTSGKVCQNGTCVPGSGSGDGGTGGNKDGGSGGAKDGGDVIIVQPDGGTVTPTGDAGSQTCAAEKTKAQQLPLDMYIMLDQSGSMKAPVAGGKTRWAAVTDALKGFLGQSNLTGMSVGIQYFALPDTNGFCKTLYCDYDSDCGGCGPCDWDYGQCIATALDETCNAADYAKAEVEIAPLPGVYSQIAASITAHSPKSATDPDWGTNTPTSAALQGAVNHAKTWQQANPQHVVIAVFATDGEPTECEIDQSKINAIAAAGYGGTPKVMTFVIGVSDNTALLNNLNGIAKAGSGNPSATAFFVDTGGDVNAQLIDAFNKIRGTALGCTYTIPKPASGTPDFNKVNVQYTPGGGGAAQVFPMVANKAACPAGKDAWYYDNASAPKQIILCDSTCNKVKADGTGSIDVLLGCTTIIN